MKFFSQFPKVPYSFDEFTPSINTQIIDMYRYVDVNRNITNDLAAYLTYSIKDGERPDQVSHKLYKTPDYHWTFFIINELLKEGTKNWPKSYIELDQYVKRNYGSYSVLEFLPKERFDKNGVFLKYNNYFGSLVFDGRLKMVRDIEGKNLQAEPVLYDAEKLQLWVKNVGSSFLSNDNAEYYLEYEGSNKQKLAWANEYGLAWFEEFHPESYLTLSNTTSVVIDEIAPFFRGEVDAVEVDQVFEVANRTYEMLDSNQRWEIDDINSSIASAGWEDGEIKELTDDGSNYDTEFTFSREVLPLKYLDPSEDQPIGLDSNQIWERQPSFPDGKLESIRAFMTPELFEEIIQPILDSAPLAAQPWISDDSARAFEIEEKFKSETYAYGTDALGSFFMDEYLQNVKFTTSRSYSESYNAPQAYADSNDTRITPYDALNADINNSNYTTYYEYENNENESKRDIVVLRESAVEPFAERYEELLNE